MVGLRYERQRGATATCIAAQDTRLREQLDELSKLFGRRHTASSRALEQPRQVWHRLRWDWLSPTERINSLLATLIPHAGFGQLCGRLQPKDTLNRLLADTMVGQQSQQRRPLEISRRLVVEIDHPRSRSTMALDHGNSLPTAGLLDEMRPGAATG